MRNMNGLNVQRNCDRLEPLQASGSGSGNIANFHICNPALHRSTTCLVPHQAQSCRISFCVPPNPLRRPYSFVASRLGGIGLDWPPVRRASAWPRCSASPASWSEPTRNRDRRTLTRIAIGANACAGDCRLAIRFRTKEVRVRDNA